MSEIIRERLKNSIGKTVLVFLNNNFRFEGKITNYDNFYLEILDYKSRSFKLISIHEIKEMEIKE